MSGGWRGLESDFVAIRWLTVVFAALMIIPTANALSDNQTEALAEQATSGGNLRIGFMQSIDSPNPFVGINEVSRFFYGLVYDGLESVDEDGNATPNLAESCYPVPLSDPEMAGMPYGSIWQYNLTRNASWCDGVGFSADDVLVNIRSVMNPMNTYGGWVASPYTCFMRTVEKVDNYTVRISFWDADTGTPIPSSYAYLIPMPIIPKHMLDKITGWWMYDWTGVWNEDLSPGMPIVGTGPFVAGPDFYQEWLAGDHITLFRSPNYHQAETSGKVVKFDELTMKFFQNYASMVLALENGEIDVAAYPPSEFNAIKDAVTSGALENVSVFEGPAINQHLTYIGFNMRDDGPNPSRLDPIVRRALHMATNKSHIIDNFYLGLGDQGTTPISSVNSKWHYEPSTTEKGKFAYDISAASSLLEANGYNDTDSDGIRECTASSPAVQLGYVGNGTELVYQLLVSKERSEEQDLATYLKSQWSLIGVGTDILILEEITISGILYSYSGDAFIWDWTADIDPNYQLFVLSSYAINGWSSSGNSSAEYDSAYKYSVNTTDPVQRKQWVDEAQRIIYNDSSYIILSYVHTGYAWRLDKFTGWGNWSAHPGLSLDNFWSANPLLFDLTFIGGEQPAKQPKTIPLYYLAILAVAVSVAVVIYLVARKGRPRLPK